jgi:hypothetical protein
MTTVKEKKRRTLFKKYAENLSLWQPEFRNQYACPLCLELFSEDDVASPAPKLTIEHAVLHGLGRGGRCLTCKVCNSEAGHSIDHHVHRTLRIEEFFGGKQSLDGTLRVDNQSASVSAAIQCDETPGFTLKIVSGNPELLDRLKTSGALPPRLDLTLPYPDYQRTRIAVLKTAYLLVFEYFGYGYAASEVLAPVRDTIRQPQNPQVPLQAIIIDWPADDLPPRMARVIAPMELDALVVPIVFPKRKKGHLVALPMSVNTFQQWNLWRADQERVLKTEFQFSVFPEGDIYLNGTHFMGFGKPDGVSVEAVHGPFRI